MTRPALAKCLKNLQPGDTLIVWKLDRLGRSVRDLLNILHDLTGQRIHFRSITEAIDTATPTGHAMLHMVALLAELERGLIRERTRAGLQEAKRRGVKFGPKFKLIDIVALDCNDRSLILLVGCECRIGFVHPRHERVRVGIEGEHGIAFVDFASVFIDLGIPQSH